MPFSSDVNTRTRRNVVGIDMIRNNRITVILEMKIEKEKINSIVGMQFF
jgi:intergrase/recombinase